MAISEYPLKKAVDAGIRYGLDYASLDACIAAGLDPWAWDNGGYPHWFMARIVAWYKLHGAIATHTEDARNIAAEKEMKKAGKK
jgi:hypothetical protein